MTHKIAVDTYKESKIGSNITTVQQLLSVLNSVQQKNNKDNLAIRFEAFDKLEMYKIKTDAEQYIMIEGKYYDI